MCPHWQLNQEAGVCAHASKLRAFTLHQGAQLVSGLVLQVLAAVLSKSLDTLQVSKADFQHHL